MQQHQTSNRSPWRVVLSYPWFLVFFVSVVLAAGCGTADDFADNLASTETEADLGTGTKTELEPEIGDLQAATGQEQPAEPVERPVLEVTPQATASEPVKVADPADPTGSTAAPSTATGAAETTTDATTAGTETTAATTQTSATAATTATSAPAATPAPTLPPETPVPTPDPTEAPPATEPPTTPPPTVAPVTAPPQAATAEPNCAVSCNIAMEGDSLTVGLGNRLCGAVKTGNCINSGIVGRRVDEMIITARTDIDNQVGSGSNDVLILWGGTNDLWQKYHSQDPSTNATAIYENVKTFVNERRANGWDYVYIMTLPPMNPTYVVGTEPLNDLIRQNTAGANGILDVGADGRLSNAFDPAMRAADGIHFGDGGRAVVMEYILGAIRELDGA